MKCPTTVPTVGNIFVKRPAFDRIVSSLESLVLSERVTPEAVADVCEHVGGIKRYSGLVGCLDELSLAQPTFKVTRLDIMAALADAAIYPVPVLRIVSSVALRTTVQDLIYSDMLETLEPMGNA